MRIGIVNDVSLAVEAMRRVITTGHQHQVAWTARDGVEAVQQCAADTPDLILMDLIMPRMDGVEATRRIMGQTPCAIVVVTANIGSTTSKVFEALGAGALDAVNTPVLEGSNGGETATALLAKIETIRKLLGGSPSRKPMAIAERADRQSSRGQPALVAIGASAGGPSALARLLGELPEAFPAPVVIVQHVDAQFASGLAVWLNNQTRLRVRVAQEGDRPQPGTVLLAGSENHLVFGSPTRLTYTREPVECSYKPSVDVFFKSANRFWPGRLIGVLLTGMGRDGAEGLLALRQSGHDTIAQDASSSAVYGMPKAAAEIRAPSEILSLDKIGARLVSLVSVIKEHG